MNDQDAQIRQPGKKPFPLAAKDHRRAARQDMCFPFGLPCQRHATDAFRSLLSDVRNFSYFQWTASTTQRFPTRSWQSWVCGENCRIVQIDRHPEAGIAACRPVPKGVQNSLFTCETEFSLRTEATIDPCPGHRQSGKAQFAPGTFRKRVSGSLTTRSCRNRHRRLGTTKWRKR